MGFQRNYDLVYVKPESFNPSQNQNLALTIDNINSTFIKQGKGYVLIGPGRWGSTDPWLGIPVKWAQISAARLIVESGLKNYRIDPSQVPIFSRISHHLELAISQSILLLMKVFMMLII